MSGKQKIEKCITSSRHTHIFLYVRTSIPYMLYTAQIAYSRKSFVVIIRKSSVVLFAVYCKTRNTVCMSHGDFVCQLLFYYHLQRHCAVFHGGFCTYLLSLRYSHRTLSYCCDLAVVEANQFSSSSCIMHQWQTNLYIYLLFNLLINILNC